ncbi:MAG: fibronectin type III domain-containing protein, partial [Melioribacteraceae bacterium]|nr:fibronectin type III domain-containing protein [Melioribacteraceae bacterium]
MKNNRLKIIFLIGVMLISAASIIQASDAPLLISPRNNSQNIKTQKLILSWFKVTDENMFNIQYALDSLFTQSSIEGNIVRFGTEAIISDLTPETKYYWRVKVDSDTSDWSTIWNFTTTGPAVKPQLSEPADGEINQQINLTFKWLDDPVNAEFDLHISSVPDFTDTIKFVTVDDTLAEVSNLGPGTVYYWRVKGYNVDARPGEWSDHFQFKTVLEEPSHLFPQDFKNNIDTSLTFRWTEIESASNYLFELSASNNFDDTELTAFINTTTTEYLFDSLKSDSIYFWRILAVNSFIDSSNWSIPTTFKTKLSPPTLVSPADSSNN